MFRGREQSRPDAGRRLLQRLADDVAEYSVIEHSPIQEGRNMSLTLAPTRKKTEAREEARREREARVKAEEAERAAKKPVTPKAAAPKAVAPKAAAPKATKSVPAADEVSGA